MYKRSCSAVLWVDCEHVSVAALPRPALPCPALRHVGSVHVVSTTENFSKNGASSKTEMDLVRSLKWLYVTHLIPLASSHCHRTPDHHVVMINMHTLSSFSSHDLETRLTTVH